MRFVLPFFFNLIRPDLDGDEVDTRDDFEDFVVVLLFLKQQGECSDVGKKEDVTAGDNTTGRLLL